MSTKETVPSYWRLHNGTQERSMHSTCMHLLIMFRFDPYKFVLFLLSHSTTEITFHLSFVLLPILTFIPRYTVQWNPAFDNEVMMHRRLFSRLQTCTVMRHIDGLNVLANRHKYRINFHSVLQCYPIKQLQSIASLWQRRSTWLWCPDIRQGQDTRAGENFSANGPEIKILEIFI